MATAHTIAVALYEEALAVFARRAGTSYTQSHSCEPELVMRAQELAHPGVRTSLTDSKPQMSSIVGLLLNGNQAGYYSPQTISTTAALPNDHPARDLDETYATLWREFLADREAFMPDGQSERVKERCLHALLQRYTWAMPAPLLSGDNDRSPVSLFDYARISAALAVCLNESSSPENVNCWLLGANLSGVQKLMGHSDANTTAGYDRRGEQAKRSAVKKLHVPYKRRF